MGATGIVSYTYCARNVSSWSSSSDRDRRRTAGIIGSTVTCTTVMRWKGERVCLRENPFSFRLWSGFGRYAASRPPTMKFENRKRTERTRVPCSEQTAVANSSLPFASASIVLKSPRACCPRGPSGRVGVRTMRRRLYSVFVFAVHGWSSAVPTWRANHKCRLGGRYTRAVHTGRRRRRQQQDAGRPRPSSPSVVIART